MTDSRKDWHAVVGRCLDLTSDALDLLSTPDTRALLRVFDEIDVILGAISKVHVRSLVRLPGFHLYMTRRFVPAAARLSSGVWWAAGFYLAVAAGPNVERPVRA